MFFSTLGLSFAKKPKEDSRAKNLFNIYGDIETKDGVVTVKGVQVLEANMYIAADTVIFEGSLVTHGHDLTIIARKVIFPKRPHGLILRPFEIIDPAEIYNQEAIKAIVQDLRLKNKFLRYPLNRTIPHIASVTGTTSGAGQDFERARRPGKVTIYAAKIVGKPAIWNLRDPYLSDYPAIESALLSGDPAKTVFSKSNVKIDAYSTVAIHYAVKLEQDVNDLFEPVKPPETPEEIEASEIMQFTSSVPGFLQRRFFPRLPVPRALTAKPLDPFFFDVTVGADGLLAWSMGLNRFEARPSLAPLLDGYNKIHSEAEKLIELLKTPEKSDEITAQVESVRELIFENEKSSADIVEKLEPNYVDAIVKLFAPDNIYLPSLVEQIKKLQHTRSDHISLYTDDWTVLDPHQSLSEWRRLYE